MREKYVILKASTSEEIERKVLSLMDLDYVSLGGASVCCLKSGDLLFIQAMELL